MTHLDLFSGIGGFALAARWNGLRTIQFVEIDKFCQRVLAKNFPGVPIHDDIKTYNHVVKNTIGCGRSHGEHGEEKSAVRRQRISGAGNGDGVYLLTGGFPCQPYSVAGKRRGAADDRALWPEMLRVIKEAKPRWVLGENVAGFVGMGLDQSIADLEGEGYEVQAFIVPACAVNAPHRRNRVWIVAHSKNSYWRASNRTDNSRWRSAEIGGSDRHAADAGRPERRPESTGRNVVNWDDSRREEAAGRSAQCGGANAADAEVAGLGMGDAERTGGSDGRTTERNERRFWNNEGRPDWNAGWVEVATRLCRVDDGLPGLVDRIRGLGNAIVPQVAAEIIRCIVEADKQQPGDFK